MSDRVYLDWNATAPLRDEARAAMIAAMDVVGNPSSVHAEGRAAKGLIETARGQVASLVGASGADVVFTSSATEAAALALAEGGVCAGIEHDCVAAHCSVETQCDANGRVDCADVLQSANSETGVLQELGAETRFCDAVQSVGKVPFSFAWSEAQCAAVSGHKFGGPKGIGALIVAQGVDVKAQILGGGQEMGRRSGTENVIGIAGFGAAAQAAERDLADGIWEPVEALRDEMEDALAAEAGGTIFFGKDVARLPNTSCFALPGWRGETQVMQMDLAGFAISAGSACSSGKVKESRVLRAMGCDSLTASSAIRVSMGPSTTRDEVMGFVDTWIKHYRRFKARAA